MYRGSLKLPMLIVLLEICTVPLWAADNPTDKSQPRTNYPVLGIVIGTPSLGVNAIAGYDFGPIEARVSGGIGNSDNSANNSISWGVQANLGYKLTDTKNTVSQIELFGNYVNLGNTSPSEIAGMGSDFSLFLYGFFVSLGLGVNLLPNHLQGLEAIAGILNFDLQIGYVYRFN